MWLHFTLNLISSTKKMSPSFGCRRRRPKQLFLYLYNLSLVLWQLFSFYLHMHYWKYSILNVFPLFQLIAHLHYDCPRWWCLPFDECLMIHLTFIRMLCAIGWTRTARLDNKMICVISIFVDIYCPVTLVLSLSLFLFGHKFWFEINMKHKPIDDVSNNETIRSLFIVLFNRISFQLFEGKLLFYSSI